MVSALPPTMIKDAIASIKDHPDFKAAFRELFAACFTDAMGPMVEAIQKQAPMDAKAIASAINTAVTAQIKEMAPQIAAGVQNGLRSQGIQPRIGAAPVGAAAPNDVSPLESIAAILQALTGAGGPGVGVGPMAGMAQMGEMAKAMRSVADAFTTNRMADFQQGMSMGLQTVSTWGRLQPEDRKEFAKAFIPTPQIPLKSNADDEARRISG